MTRDDFPTKIKLKLAQRVGYRCSIPACRIITVGPGEESQESVNNIGMASHIYGAVDSPNSPRSNAEMTTAERKSIENGIWTCRNCGTKIDNDEETYTPEKLKEWKKESEQHAKTLLGSSHEPTRSLYEPTVSEKRDQIIANAYFGIPGLFLAFFRLTPVFISQHKQLSQKAKHAFGIPDESFPFPSLDVVPVETKLNMGKYVFLGTSSDRGRGAVLDTLAIDEEVLKEVLVDTPIETIPSNAYSPNGTPLTVLEWCKILAQDVYEKCNELLTKYAAAGSPELIDRIELLKNKSDLVRSFENNGNEVNLFHAKRFLLGMIMNIVWLYRRFEELKKLP